MKISTLALIAALTIPLPGFAQDAAPQAPAATSAMTDPQQFAAKATVSNMFEIVTSKLALQKAAGDDAKNFAQHMVDDHTKAGDEMKAAAQEQGNIELPGALDDQHQAMLDELNGFDGEEFDARYLSMQLAAHQDAVALFESYSKNGSEGPLKQFAAKTLPTLQGHLSDVEKIATSSTVDNGAAPSSEQSAATSTAVDGAPPVSSILATGYTVTDKDNLATEIIGKQVYSSEAAEAEYIGDVNNLVVGDNGQVAAVVIGVGGFLGIGEKNVAVNYSELQWVVATDNTERFVLPTTKEALQSAPDFRAEDQTPPPSAAPTDGAAPAPAGNGAVAPAN